MSETKKKKISFNNAIDNIIQPQVNTGILSAWSLQGQDLINFFTVNKDTENADLQRIATNAAGYAQNSPELFLARLIVGQTTSPPKAGGGGIAKVRTYVSDVQKSHDDLKKAAQAAIEEFIKTNPMCVQLAGMKRQCLAKDGSIKEMAIEAKIHMRNALAVIDSYELQAAPTTVPAAPQPAPAPQQPQAQAIPAQPAPPPQAPVQAATAPAPVAPAPVAPAPQAAQTQPTPVVPQTAPKKGGRKKKQ